MFNSLSSRCHARVSADPQDRSFSVDVLHVSSRSGATPLECLAALHDRGMVRDVDMRWPLCFFEAWLVLFRPIFLSRINAGCMRWPF